MRKYHRLEETRERLKTQNEIWDPLQDLGVEEGHEWGNVKLT